MIRFKTAAVVASETYRPQLASPARIVLPQRYGKGYLLLCVLCAMVGCFLYDQAKPASTPRPIAPLASPISRAEAAPVTVPSQPPALTTPSPDPRLDEVAALMPAATLRELPTKSVAQAKPHTIDIDVRAAEMPAATSPATGFKAYLANGIAAGRNGNLAAADTALRQALALDPGNPLVLYNLGLVAERRGDFDTAGTLYETALQNAAMRPDTPLQPDQIMERLKVIDEATGTDDL